MLVTVPLHITSICLLSGDGADKLVMTFTLPSGIYPWSGNSHATMEITKGHGLRYIVTHMWGIETTVIDTSYSRTDDRPLSERRAKIDWDRHAIVTDAGTAAPLPQPGVTPPVDDPDYKIS